MPSPYLLFFHELPPSYFKKMSAEERQDLLNRWNAWYDGLAAEGKVLHGNPLEPEVRLVSGTRGERVVDGPFAEGKEAIGGYFFLMVEGLEEATRIAQGCPNLEHGMTVEVRAVADACGSLGVRGRQPAAVAVPAHR